MQPSIDLTSPPSSPCSSQQSCAAETDECIGQAGPATAAETPLVKIANAIRRVKQNRCIASGYCLEVYNPSIRHGKAAVTHRLDFEVRSPVTLTRGYGAGGGRWSSRSNPAEAPVGRPRKSRVRVVSAGHAPPRSLRAWPAWVQRTDDVGVRVHEAGGVCFRVGDGGASAAEARQAQTVCANARAEVLDDVEAPRGNGFTRGSTVEQIRLAAAASQADRRRGALTLADWGKRASGILKSFEV